MLGSAGSSGGNSGRGGSAGSAGTTSAGTGGAGATGDESGCGCSVPRDESTGAWLSVILAFGVAAFRRRKLGAR